MDNSRRKLAQTLHHLGDEIQPQSHPEAEPRSWSGAGAAAGQDMSMTEDTSEAAEERRRAIREELERRSAALAARRRKSAGGSPASSFDAMVDKQGRLLDVDGDEVPGEVGNAVDTAGSTGVDLGLSSSSQVVQRSGDHSPRTPVMTPSGRESPTAAASQTDANSIHSLAELGSRASTPSTLSEFSHVHHPDGDARSGTATPAGWSEVGSEISNEESRYFG